MKLSAVTAALIALCLCFAAEARSEDPLRAYAGINGVWYDDDARPADFEAGGNLRASLSPHISLVSAAYYGFERSYLRGSLGGRITATDVNDPNFSIGIGMQYHASTEPAVRPEGWAPDVSLGWKPQPERWPAIVLVGQAAYLTGQDEVLVIAGVRYDLGSFGGVR